MCSCYRIRARVVLFAETPEHEHCDTVTPRIHAARVPPRYNAEVAPKHVRGFLVALQQLAITFGIMVAL
jgi:hypothetical protein